MGINKYQFLLKYGGDFYSTQNNFCDLEDDKLRESFIKTGEYYVVR